MFILRHNHHSSAILVLMMLQDEIKSLIALVYMVKVYCTSHARCYTRMYTPWRSPFYVIGQLNFFLINLFCLKFQFYHQNSWAPEFEKCRCVLYNIRNKYICIKKICTEVRLSLFTNDKSFFSLVVFRSHLIFMQKQIEYVMFNLVAIYGSYELLYWHSLGLNSTWLITLNPEIKPSDTPLHPLWCICTAQTVYNFVYCITWATSARTFSWFGET